MNVAELIGFVITMVAFFILIVKRSLEERKKRQHPEEYEKELEERQAQIHAILNGTPLEPQKTAARKKKKSQTAPPPIPKKMLSHQEAEKKEEPRLHKKQDALFFDPYKQEERSTYAHAYQIQAAQVPVAKVRKWLLEEGSLKKAILLREILGPAKACRKPK